MDSGHSFFDFPETVHGWRRQIPLALIAALTLVVYGGTLHFGFVYDDLEYVVNNFKIQGFSAGRLLSIWTSTYAHQYAPLHLTLLSAVYAISGLNPFGYHLAQLLLHLACACVLYLTLKQMEQSRVALLATLLFCVYPPNTETVAWVSETKSTLAFLLFLFALSAYLRLSERGLRLSERGAWSDGLRCAFFFVLSLLAKVSTIVAPAIFLLYDYSKGRLSRRSLLRVAPFFAISALFAALTMHYYGVNPAAISSRLADGISGAAAASHHPDSGGYYGGPVVHLLNFPRFLLFYVRMIFFPYPLSGWHMVPIQESLSWPLAAVWLAVAALVAILLYSPRKVQFWGLWFIVFLAPVLQLVPNAAWVADRYLYIPAIGAFVLIGKLFFHFADQFRTLPGARAWDALMLAILLVFTWQTERRLPVWSNDLTFWQATVPTCASSAFCHQRLGMALLDAGQPDQAVAELRRAVQIRPAPDYLIDLGDAYMNGTGQYTEAVAAYTRARQIAGPLPLYFWAEMAEAYYLSGDLQDAAGVVQASQRIDPADPTIALVGAFVQWKQGNQDQARRFLGVAMQGNHFFPGGISGLLLHYWKRPEEVRRMLADLGMG